MKRYHQDKELTIYQEEILKQKETNGTSNNKDDGKTYFPDLLTPYQRELLAKNKDFHIMMEMDVSKSEQKRNKLLHDAVLMCYIVGIIGSASLCGCSVHDKQVKKPEMVAHQVQKNNLLIAKEKSSHTR